MCSCHALIGSTADRMDKGHILEHIRMHARRASPRILFAALLGFGLVAAFFAWESHCGLSLWDEGYLWYGVQRVMAGEVPIRDFQAYDPGRYYWSALLMSLTRTNGIVAIRGTLAVLQALSLAVALCWLAVTGARRNGGGSIMVSALVLLAWMVPRHKLFDISISIDLVCMLAYLVRRPSRSSYLATGVLVGLAAYFGRNHGVYGVIASCGVFLYLAVRCADWSGWRHGIVLFVAGIFVGYLPMFATMLLAHGFTSAFIDSIRFLFQIKETNLPLPVPWPWHAPFGSAPPADALRALLVGLFFVAIVLFAGLSVCYVLWARAKSRGTPALLVACAFCAVPYAHYAFSRADPGHLAQGIFPALMGVLVLILSSPSWVRLLTAAALCAASWFTTAPMHPGLQCMEKSACERVTVGNDVLRMDHSTAHDIMLLRRLKSQYAPDGQNFFVAPFMPGAYALLGAKSPTWEIYTAWPRSDAFQEAEIGRLEAARPVFILVEDIPLDGRDALRYRNTHPLIEQYIRANYIPTTDLTDNPAYRIYRPKGS